MRFQLLCIQWIKECEKIKNEQNLPRQKELLDNIVNILNDFDKNSLFKKEVSAKGLVIQNSIIWKEEVVIDTDDPLDIMLCGTDVSTCLDINKPNNIGSLLDFLVDGKNKLIAVKTSKGPLGKILSCAILHLLLDSDGKPVLYLEKNYGGYQYEKDIISMAKEKASEMKIPLVGYWAEGQLYKGKLIALGGPAPSEFVDALDSPQMNGKYEIKYARYFD